MTAPVSTSDDAGTVESDTSNVRVVVVDDSPDFRQLLAMLLRAHDGLEVVAQAEHGAAGLEAVVAHRPDVVVTDLQMPVLDGIGLTRAIRESLPELPDLPIVVLTAYPTDEALREAELAGATRFIAKRGDIGSVVPTTILELVGVE